MYRYRMGDLTIASSSAIGGLRTAPPVAGEWRFRISRAPAPVVRRPYHRATWPGVEEPWRALGRVGSSHVVRFHRTATFVLDIQARRVTAFQRHGQSRDAIHQLLLSQVLPLVLGQGGRVVLHASAAASARGVIGFVGAPRHGKSSIVMALAAAGYAVAADDCLVVDPARGCRVVPVDIGVRLWPDAAARHRLAVDGRRARFSVHPHGKRRATLGELGVRRATRPQALRRLYLLQPGASRVSVSRVPPGEAVVRLLEASFQLGHDSRTSMREAFDGLIQLVDAVGVRQLAYPRNPEMLPEIIRLVGADQ